MGRNPRAPEVTGRSRFQRIAAAIYREHCAAGPRKTSQRSLLTQNHMNEVSSAPLFDTQRLAA